MSQHKACILPHRQGRLIVGVRPTPIPQRKQALVKVTATAINPADWKILIYGVFVESFPAVLGTDGAGIIEAVGSEVDNFEVGDKVFFQGFYHHADETTFQQYCIVETDIISTIPSNITEDQASTIPVGALTALVCLFQTTGIDFPASKLTAAGRGVLILGGSSSVGQFGIQLARIAGFSPIVTTASTKHTDLLKSLGATHVFDRDVDTKTIQSVFSTPVSLVVDSISTASTQSLAFDVLTTPSPIPGAHLAVVLPLVDSIKKKNADNKVTVRLVYGSSHTFRDLSVPFWQNVGKWIKDGRLVPNRVQVVKGGLAAIPEALELSRKGVSGVKLIILLQEEEGGQHH
ncbi:putative zinc type alcohol dehydrogenase [Rhizoctonia solani 123E]|uniref:Putative zinc type alcohol dehydrogenase n=1 Tax=Rhizoctonia solani 123E TaxID=1423351 RepID=A0A074RKA7_9AGAM|nr:putative zinc type alcohol dehydrogenase [Rhizoctonia solani 123E]